MLAITDEALEALKLLVEETGAEGLRISTSAQSLIGAGPALQLEPAVGPELGDEILDADGARVFVARSMALGDKVLDAEIEAGQINFALRQQG